MTTRIRHCHITLLGLFAVVGITVLANAQTRDLVAFVVEAHDGGPVAGATVSLGSETPLTQTPARASTTTDSSGAFTLKAPIDSGVLSISAPGFATKRMLMSSVTALSERPARIEMERGATLSVTVRNTLTQQPVPSILSVATNHPGNSVFKTVRSSTGTFDLEDLSSGPTVLVARAQGLAVQTRALTLVAGQTHGQAVFTLEAAAEIAGVVVGSSGQPIAQAAVRTKYNSRSQVLNSFVGGRVVTDPDGRFVLTDIVPNLPLLIQAASGDLSSPVVSVTLQTGERRTGLLLTIGERSQ